MFILAFFLSFYFQLAFSTIESQDQLPFDDDSDITNEQFITDSIEDQNPNDVSSTPIPEAILLEEAIEKLKKIPIPQTFLQVIQIREIIVLIILVIYIYIYINGRKSINKMVDKTKCTILEKLTKYYIAVPQRMTPSSLHRYDTFSTGRRTHLGCLTTLRLTKRCDILGILYDKFYIPKRRKKSIQKGSFDDLSGAFQNISYEYAGFSSISLEIAIDQVQKLPMILHISDHRPFYSKEFKLLEYPIYGSENNGLKCYSDFEESTEIFIPYINKFLESHPNSISMIEISDSNRFELRGESRFVVLVSFKIDDEFNLAEDAVDFAVGLADKYATLEVPFDILDRMQRSRTSILNEQKEELQKKGIITQEDIDRAQKKKQDKLKKNT